MANIGEFTGDILPGAMQTAVSVKYRFALLTGSTNNDRKIVIAGNAADALGIMTDDGDAIGAQTGIAINGLGYLCVDGDVAAIAVGDRLDPDAAGKGVKIAADQGGYSAIALQPSTADGDVIRVSIERGDISTA